MEKKGNRSVQASSKGPGTDKKNLDGTSNKLWPRNGRRREPNGSSFPTKNENSRKPIQQRNKSIDKRPRSRGNYYSGVVDGNENTRVDGREDAELGSVFVPGSKKQSLNHLLNFHYPSREGQWSSATNVKGGHKLISTGKHKYNKEQFLQANCQFIVKASGNYKQYLNNPDALVDWHLIEQVNVQVSEFPSCPICLYPPVAAKMTRCGHIYCWSCVLHYLALSDKTFRKCPICYEAVHKGDLKSVASVPYSSFNVNDNITFKLMKRLRGSLIVYPANQVIQEEKCLFNVSDDSASSKYCKLLLANRIDVLNIIEREQRELEVLLQTDENAPEKCFIEQALALLYQRRDTILTETSNPQKPKQEETNTDTFFVLESNVLEHSCKALDNISLNTSGATRNHLESISSNSIASEDFNDASVLSEDLDASFSSNKHQLPTKVFYFYQASDGEHIYLHALNVRMLERTYGSLEYCPQSLTGRILEKENGSMTEELRKRLRYLQHLPVTCQFEVAEIHLNESLLSKETVDHFHDQVETRRKRRQRRARDEKWREKQLVEVENRMMGKYPAAKIHIDSPYQFPDFGYDGASTSTKIEYESSFPENNFTESGNFAVEYSSSAGSLSTENEFSGPSFAKMLSSKSTKKPTWPQLKSNQTPNQKLITITGSQSQPIPIIRKNRSDSEPELEEYAPSAYNRNFSDAIALALERASKSDKIDDDNKAQGGKKKKKNKQKILFATSMTYSGK